MRKLYFLGSLLLAVGTAYAGTDPVIEKGTQDQLQAYIARSEYFINWQSNTGIYQSNNRQHSLLATYTAQEMLITPRNAAQQWSFGLTVKGITADGQSLYQPAAQTSVKMHDGTVRFNHDDHYIVEYVNNDQGIRQNFIIQQPATKARTLSVQLQTAEGWQTFKRNETSLTFRNGQQLLSYNDLKVWDANGTILPAHFSVQDNQVQIAVDVEKAVYPITIDPIVLNGTPQNANTFLQGNQVGAILGMEVARGGKLNNDNYDDILLGAPGYQHANGGNGAVFVYYGSIRGIVPFTYTLLTPNTPGGQYGVALGTGGDLNGDGYDDVVLNADDSTHQQGGIAVYYGSSSGVTTTPEIVYGDPSYGTLGISIAISKDVTGDAFDDIIIGSGSASHGQANEGTITIIPGSDWGVSFTPWIVIEGNQAGLRLGSRIVAAGDINNDGYNDIAVTATHQVLTFMGGPDGMATTPTNTLNINLSVEDALAIAGGGDINGDGYTDIILGIPYYSNDQSGEGATYIYHGGSTGIGATPATILEGNQEGAGYGFDIEFAGDINNDGYADIIVGSPNQENGSQEREGMAFVYYGRATGINPVPASTIQSNQSGAILGYSVSSAGDVNNDGNSDVLIGAIAFSNGQVAEGAAFVYHGGAGSAGLLTADAPVTASKAPMPSTTVAAVKVFPNPVVNDLFVQLQGLDSQTPTYIQIMNVQGGFVQTVKAGNVVNYQQSIDISRLTAGIYFVVIQNGSKVFREKIIKQ
ncbi:Por secretion system C-terminal sorting domain-containing protein [Chitinophaga sp. YR627]|uniref:FG-GAP-like repeat-containing protein n=1 Tax=Chitinophaga sp. YR627 TaxID=1881041 RepID=UPI0008EEB5AF|nr:FG-GAP-like repeat-containing protein [Chitinophaga sp. YR627]SFM90929.1 Por secretion system C-terminal sorting domain-containing protein [Chitinophaga sp. YR627]